MNQVYQQRFIDLLNQVNLIETRKTPKMGLYDVSYESIDDNEFLGWCVKAKGLIARVCGETSIHLSAFIKAETTQNFLYPIDNLRRSKSVFLAAKEDFEGGYLISIRNMIHAEVFSSELDQARELLKSGYYPAAAIIAGIVLETSMRDVCVQMGIATGKLNKMNEDLAKAGRYNTLIQKKITAHAAIRNSAAHGNNTEFSAEDVAPMIEDVERLIGDFLS